MDATIMKNGITRRDFLSAAAGATVVGLVLQSIPSLASAGEISPMSLTTGKRINPYSVTMSNSKTLSSFSDPYMLFELRRGFYNGSNWLWIRGTAYQGNNAVFGQGAKLVTPYGTVSDGMIYGTGSTWDYGSQRCTPAISIGIPSSTITVTFSGGTWGGYYTKTVQIYYQDISHAAQYGG